MLRDLFIINLMDLIMKKMILIFITSVVFLTGCNTIAGAGQDIQDGGNAITKAADDVKSKM